MKASALRRILGTSLACASLLHSACDRPAAPKTVLLVIVDTLRLDHLGCYGYSRDTSPNLDRLAAEGERYQDAWASAPWTLPAVASIVTGQPPHVHGAGRGARGVHPVRPTVPTLAEKLHEAGWSTSAVVSVIWCSPESGLARGFDRYDHHTSDASNVGTRDARETTDHALAAARAAGRRDLFLVVHYFDPHLTYDPPAPFDTMFDPEAAAQVGRGFGTARQVHEIADGRLVLDARRRRGLVARYDGEIRYVDQEFGRLRDGLQLMGRWDQALVIVVGDHGEEFWDHGGFEHGHSHHSELLHVPLLVRRPGGPAGKVVADRVRQIDIAPTVLAYAGVAAVDLPGRALGSARADFAVAEGSLWGGDLASVRSDRGGFLWNRTTGRWQLFAANDAAETSDLARDGAPPRTPEVELLETLPPSRTSEPGEWTPRDEDLERLRSLGYIR
jgi:arylsulfatase A-like enzyme